MSADYPRVEISSAVELRKWLIANDQTAKGIWLVTYKKAVGNRHVPYEEIVREALCFGWIDGQAKPLDATRSQRLLTPRKPKSKWSGPNKARITDVTATGLMHPAGQAMVELAKRTGTWTALDARRYWDAFPPSTRRAILEWIGSAKRPETHQMRIVETVQQAALNVRANQWPPV